jgi:aminoglycoside phosphotransferase (APT) family kinase protein
MQPADAIVQSLRKAGVIAASDTPHVEALSGGVSGDVFRVDLPAGSLCVKQPLERLRVAAEWHAPVERAHSEVAWLRFAAAIDPAIVPEVIYEDREQHLFAMTFLPPERYPGWKAQLLAGIADAQFAAAVGRSLAAIHAESAGRADLATAFANQDLFHALRIEPYLLYTAKAHPAVAPGIEAMANGIAQSRIALMHGDVSPKNILCGPKGPVFLDAETACYGDPSFDLAFCLNHLLLKAAFRPASASAYSTSFEAMRAAYFAGVTWEAREALDARTARLLAALFLARIDGKSPVEYLTADSDKALVRDAAITFLEADSLSLRSLADGWYARFTS